LPFFLLRFSLAEATFFNVFNLELIEETRRNPFEGKGKPEPLKHGLKGMWSRRITDKHRMVYHGI